MISSQCHSNNNVNNNNTIKDKWLVNLTDCTLPDYVYEVMQLGPNFDFSLHLHTRETVEVLENIDFNLRDNDDEPICKKLLQSIKSHINPHHTEHTEKII